MFAQVSVSGAGDSRERVRHYYADHTFDSAVCATHPNYASQEKVCAQISGNKGFFFSQ